MDYTEYEYAMAMEDNTQYCPNCGSELSMYQDENGRFYTACPTGDFDIREKERDE